MFDLFGLGKSAPPPPGADEPPAEAPGQPAAPSRGAHRVWAVLLVCDSIFFVVFAGAVAAKIFQHWGAPPPAPAAGRKGREPSHVKREPAASTKAAEPAAQTPPPAQEDPKPKAKEEPPPKPAAPAKEPPSPKALAPAKTSVDERAPRGAMRPPKPSLLAEPPRPRQAAPSAAPAAKSAPAAPAPKPASGAGATGEAPKTKAVAVAFRLKAPQAKSVQLIGAFIVRGGRREMDRHSDGTWSLRVYLHPGSYRYFFSVDKKKVLDPENPREERGASVLVVP